jgi:hypothetical protein
MAVIGNIGIIVLVFSQSLALLPICLLWPDVSLVFLQRHGFLSGCTFFLIIKYPNGNGKIRG